MRRFSWWRRQTNKTDCFTPCACARDNNIIWSWTIDTRCAYGTIWWPPWYHMAGPAQPRGHGYGRTQCLQTCFSIKNFSSFSVLQYAFQKFTSVCAQKILANSLLGGYIICHTTFCASIKNLTVPAFCFVSIASISACHIELAYSSINTHLWLVPPDLPPWSQHSGLSLNAQMH